MELGIEKNVSKEIRKFWQEIKKEKNYYFERLLYAKKHIELIKDTNLSIAIFKKRRKGKTSFLMNDFAKVASREGYVFYFSFYEQGEKPNEIPIRLKRKLLDFVVDVFLDEKKDLAKELKSRILNVKKGKFSIGFQSLFGVKMEIDAEKPLSKQNEIEFYNNITLTEIFGLIDELADKRVYFIFDEFQEISSGKFTPNVNDGFIKELRTCLDIRKTSTGVVFTGSSTIGLETFFSKYNSAFFEFGTRLGFEDLGDDFILSCTSKLNKKLKTAEKAKFEDLKEVFDKTGKYPSILISIMGLMVFNNENNPFVFMNNTSLYKEDFEIEKEWKNFSKLEKAILYRVIKIEANKIGSKENIDWYKEIVDKNLTGSKVAHAINGLKMNNVLSKDKQNWSLINEGLREFILERVELKENEFEVN